MYHNPVNRGLGEQLADWPWSSWRHYYRQDSFILGMDRLTDYGYNIWPAGDGTQQ